MRSFLFLALFFPAILQAETTCLGPKEAKFSVVYLHGMDSPNPGVLELENRAKLLRIAKALRIGIALPRAKNPCPSNPALNCWGAGSSYDQLAGPTLKLAVEVAQSCFPEARPLTVLGFSNGGYLVNRALLLCLKTSFKFFVTSGSGGTVQQREPLADCGDFTLVGGKNDSIISSIRKFARELRKFGAHVTLTEHEGGHSLPENEIQNLLRAQIESLKDTFDAKN